MINQYKQRLSIFIDAQKKINLPFLTTQNSPAQWSDNDIKIEMENKKFRSVYVYNSCSRKSNVGCKNVRTLPTEHQLETYYADTLKAVFLELLATSVSSEAAYKKFLVFRLFLSYMQNKSLKIHQINPSLLNKFYQDENIRYEVSNRLCYILFILKGRGIIASHLEFKALPFEGDNSLDGHEKRSLEKMPDEQIIFAIGGIFHEIMPKTGDSINIYDGQLIKNQAVAAWAVMTLSMPQRAGAELFYIHNQKVQSKEVKVRVPTDDVDFNKEPTYETKTIYDLEWQGSKLFKDHKKHIRADMVPYVEQALNFFDVICEPARALCRFYANPNTPAYKIIGKFPVTDWHGIDKNKKVTLWQLIGLLGIFEHQYPAVCKEILSKSVPGFPYQFEMTMKNLTIVQKAALLGVDCTENKRVPDELRGKSLTVKEIEEKWISYQKSVMPNFPKRLHTNRNNTLLSNALTIFTGSIVTSSCSYRSVSLSQISSHL